MGLPVTGVFAPGLINNPGFIYDPQLQGLGFSSEAHRCQPVHLITPSTTTTLQGLVGGSLRIALNQMAASAQAPAGEQNNLKDQQ